MRVSVKKTAKKAAAITLVAAMALSLAPAANAGAKKKTVKAPTISKSTLVIKEGATEKLTVKKGTYKIKSTTWKSANKKVAKVSKKGVVTGVMADKSTKITATVVTKKTKKKTKKYTLTCKVEVIEPDYESEVEPGRWYTTIPIVSETVFKMVDAVNSDQVGASYYPLINLGEKADGDGKYSWRVFCRETILTEPSKTTYAIIEVSQNTEAEEVTLVDVKPVTDIGPYPQTAETPGGWEESAPEAVGFDGELDAKISEKILALSNIGVSYTPLAKIGANVSAGVYCVIAEKFTVTAQEKIDYAIFFVAVDHATSEVTIEEESTKTIEFD
ncbi:MAG: Ig-like domain-containing protein [Eubacterium sp.]|nr:Ig-like domain-containing protein [Eubacterium sp.]